MNKEELRLKINEKWMLTDTDDCLEVFAYEQGRTDAIEELSDLIDRLLWDYDLETYKDLSESFKESARLLKEKKK